MINTFKKLFVYTSVTTTLFVTNVFAHEKMITSYNVNFRNAPSTSAEIIKLVQRGTVVDVMETHNEWSKVTIDEVGGYIRSDLLSQYDSQNIENVQNNIENVELLDWNTVKNILKIGEDLQIYDVYTGKTYYVRSFSNGLHADVEPITVEDTNIMKQTFDGEWSWTVRPVVVKVGGRAIAASINGMPHGGGVNPNNGMNGQVCIHFLGSSTHNGNTSFAKLHQDYVMNAYNFFN